MSNRFRSIVHASAIIVPIFAEATSKTIAVTALLGVTGFYALSELLRLRGRRLPLVTAFTLGMSRTQESAHFISEPVYLAIGVILALMLFPKNIAYASIAIVAVGDPVAGYVGEKFGRTRVGQKSLEGFIMGLIAASFAASFFISPIVGLAGSTIAMLVELLGILNDNLTMPLCAGASMMLVALLLSTGI